MQHYAIVKCEREELVCYYDKTVYWHKYWKDKALEAIAILENKNYSTNTYSHLSRKSWIEKLLRYLEEWEYSLRARECEYYIGKKTYKNGLHTIWEGLVNLERLRVSDTLYIPTLEEYKEIKKVEVNPSGKIVYYIDHIEVFKTSYEKSRIKAVEQWFENFYPDYNSYDELKKHKNERNPILVEFEEYSERAQKILKPEINISETVLDDKEKLKIIQTEKPLDIPKIIEKFDNDADEQWQAIVLFGFLGTIGIVLLMLIFGLN